MKSLSGRHVLVLFLFLALLLAVQLLAQDETARTPLPVPESPVLTLDSDIVNSVETGDFVISSSNTDLFANADQVEWVAANGSTRDVLEGTVAPALAGLIRVDAGDLNYQAGDIISFSLTSLAALDDATYEDSPSLIFCYPVHESCRDPRTLVRSLPPPLDATVVLVTPEPSDDGAPAAQASNGGGTFEVHVPKRGTVIDNAEGYSWQAQNTDGNSAEGQKELGNSEAQAQAVDTSEVIRFGADLIDFQSQEALRIVLRTVAPTGSNSYVDSHPVVYYYCSDPSVNCPAYWAGGPRGNDGDDGDGGGAAANCLNTDNAAPIKVCANADYTSYTLYGVYQDSTTTSLASVTSASSLCGSDAAANSNMVTATNPAANKAYTVSYDGDCTMALSTYYADKGPDVDKPYIITIDEHHTVRYVQW